MPQPKRNQPQDKPDDAPAPDAPDTPDAPDAPDSPRVKPGDFNPAVHDLLLLAQDLRDEKENVYERITDNREVLRRYLNMNMVNDDQREAVEAFYPRPNRKGKGDSANGDTATDTDTTTADDTAATAA